MSAGRNRLKIEIFGQSYTVLGQAAPEQVERIARYVDGKMRELHEQNERLDFATLAVLTALNIAETHDSLLQEYEDLLNLLASDQEQKIN